MYKDILGTKSGGGCPVLKVSQAQGGQTDGHGGQIETTDSDTGGHGGHGGHGGQHGQQG